MLWGETKEGRKTKKHNTAATRRALCDFLRYNCAILWPRPRASSSGPGLPAIRAPHRPRIRAAAWLLPRCWNLLWQRPRSSGSCGSWSQLEPWLSCPGAERSDDMMWSLLTPSGNVSLRGACCPIQLIWPQLPLNQIWRAPRGPPLVTGGTGTRRPAERQTIKVVMRWRMLCFFCSSELSP